MIFLPILATAVYALFGVPPVAPVVPVRACERSFQQPRRRDATSQTTHPQINSPERINRRSGRQSGTSPPKATGSNYTQPATQTAISSPRTTNIDHIPAAESEIGTYRDPQRPRKDDVTAPRPQVPTGISLQQTLPITAEKTLSESPKVSTLRRSAQTQTLDDLELTPLGTDTIVEGSRRTKTTQNAEGAMLVPCSDYATTEPLLASTNKRSIQTQTLDDPEPTPLGTNTIVEGSTKARTTQNVEGAVLVPRSDQATIEPLQASTVNRSQQTQTPDNQESSISGTNTTDRESSNTKTVQTEESRVLVSVSGHVAATESSQALEKRPKESPEPETTYLQNRAEQDTNGLTGSTIKLQNVSQTPPRLTDIASSGDNNPRPTDIEQPRKDEDSRHVATPLQNERRSLDKGSAQPRNHSNTEGNDVTRNTHVQHNKESPRKANLENARHETTKPLKTTKKAPADKTGIPKRQWNDDPKPPRPEVPKKIFNIKPEVRSAKPEGVKNPANRNSETNSGPTAVKGNQSGEKSDASTKSTKLQGTAENCPFKKTAVHSIGEKPIWRPPGSAQSPSPGNTRKSPSPGNTRKSPSPVKRNPNSPKQTDNTQSEKALKPSNIVSRGSAHSPSPETKVQNSARPETRESNSSRQSNTTKISTAPTSSSAVNDGKTSGPEKKGQIPPRKLLKNGKASGTFKTDSQKFLTSGSTVQRPNSFNTTITKEVTATTFRTESASKAKSSISVNTRTGTSKALTPKSSATDYIETLASKHKTDCATQDKFVLAMSISTGSDNSPKPKTTSASDYIAVLANINKKDAEMKAKSISKMSTEYNKLPNLIYPEQSVCKEKGTRVPTIEANSIHSVSFVKESPQRAKRKCFNKTYTRETVSSRNKKVGNSKSTHKPDKGPSKTETVKPPAPTTCGFTYKETVTSRNRRLATAKVKSTTTAHAEHLQTSDFGDNKTRSVSFAPNSKHLDEDVNVTGSPRKFKSGQEVNIPMKRGSPIYLNVNIHVDQQECGLEQTSSDRISRVGPSPTARHKEPSVTISQSPKKHRSVGESQAKSPPTSKTRFKF